MIAAGQNSLADASFHVYLRRTVRTVLFLWSYSLKISAFPISTLPRIPPVLSVQKLLTRTLNFKNSSSPFSPSLPIQRTTLPFLALPLDEEWQLDWQLHTGETLHNSRLENKIILFAIWVCRCTTGAGQSSESLLNPFSVPVCPRCFNASGLVSCVSFVLTWLT